MAPGPGALELLAAHAESGGDGSPTGVGIRRRHGEGTVQIGETSFRRRGLSRRPSPPGRSATVREDREERQHELTHALAGGEAGGHLLEAGWAAGSAHGSRSSSARSSSGPAAASIMAVPRIPRTRTGSSSPTTPRPGRRRSRSSTARPLLRHRAVGDLGRHLCDEPAVRVLGEPDGDRELDAVTHRSLPCRACPRRRSLGGELANDAGDGLRLLLGHVMVSVLDVSVRRSGRRRRVAAQAATETKALRAPRTSTAPDGEIGQRRRQVAAKPGCGLLHGVGVRERLEAAALARAKPNSARLATAVPSRPG